MDRIDKQIPVAHQGILAYGRVIREGRELYPNNIEFSQWIARKKLNFGRFAGDPVERSNCMKLADLVDVGVATEDGIVYRLDLTNCKITAPSNILKWARTNQPDMFPHLAKKKSATKPKDSHAPVPDGRTATACQFCGTSASQAGELLLGPAARPSAAICFECVEIAVALVAERKKPTGRKARTFEQALRREVDESAPIEL
jgi:hypothetical protein